MRTLCLGHNSTYVGAKPGVVAQSLIDMGDNNGIMFFDELDKQGKQVAEALLHAFDPVQSATFTDNYFSDIPVDLSNVFFVCSLNRLDNLDPKLLDRLAMVSVEGYDKEEKTVIANDFLLGKIVLDTGFAPGEVVIGKDVLAVILDMIEQDEQLLAQHEDAADRDQNVYRPHHHQHAMRKRSGIRVLKAFLKTLVKRIRYAVLVPEASLASMKEMLLPVHVTEAMVREVHQLHSPLSSLLSNAWLSAPPEGMFA